MKGIEFAKVSMGKTSWLLPIFSGKGIEKKEHDGGVKRMLKKYYEVKCKFKWYYRFLGNVIGLVKKYHQSLCNPL